MSERVYAVINEAGDATAFATTAREAIDEAHRVSAQVVGDPQQLATKTRRNPGGEVVDGGFNAYFLTGLYEKLKAQGVLLGTVPAPRTLVPVGKSASAIALANPQYRGGEGWYGFTVEHLYSMSEDEAFRRVRPYLPKKPAWNKKGAAISKLLATNTKTAKILGATDHFSKSIGLNLMPHQIAFREGAGNGPSNAGYSFTDYSTEYGQWLQSDDERVMANPHAPGSPARKYTLCAGSVVECRQACLVYAGQNPVTDDSFQAKLGLTYALLNEPHAFIRLLASAIQREFGRGAKPTEKDMSEVVKFLYEGRFDAMLGGDDELGFGPRVDVQRILEKTAATRTDLDKHVLDTFKLEVKASIRDEVAAVEAELKSAGKQGLTVHRWIRLNVLSDIPWELIVPEWFTGEPVRLPKFKGKGVELRSFVPPLCGFYDYTKVPARSPGPKYDLTLSYSGDNQAACAWHLSKGGKVAAVFVRSGELTLQKRAKGVGAAQKLRKTAAGMSNTADANRLLTEADRIEREGRADFYTKFEYAGTGSRVGQRIYAKQHLKFVPMAPEALVQLFGAVYPVTNGDLTDVRGEDRQQFGLTGGSIVHLAYKPSQAAYYEIVHGHRVRNMKVSYDIEAKASAKGAEPSSPERFSHRTRRISFVVAVRKVTGGATAADDVLVLDGGVTAFQSLNADMALKIATFGAAPPEIEVAGEDEAAAKFDRETEQNPDWDAIGESIGRGAHHTFIAAKAAAKGAAKGYRAARAAHEKRQAEKERNPARKPRAWTRTDERELEDTRSKYRAYSYESGMLTREERQHKEWLSNHIDALELRKAHAPRQNPDVLTGKIRQTADGAVVRTWDYKGGKPHMVDVRIPPEAAAAPDWRRDLAHPPHRLKDVAPKAKATKVKTARPATTAKTPRVKVPKSKPAPEPRPAPAPAAYPPSLQKLIDKQAKKVASGHRSASDMKTDLENQRRASVIAEQAEARARYAEKYGQHDARHSETERARSVARHRATVGQLNRVVVVSCSGPKLDHPAPAKDLYTSPLFKLSREWAEQDGSPWYIISAKHGLLRPDEVIAPYDERVPAKGARRDDWNAQVRQQLLDELRPLEPVEVWLFAGQDYVEPFVQWVTGSAARGDGLRALIEPLKGKGVGERLHWLKEAIEAKKPTPHQAMMDKVFGKAIGLPPKSKPAPEPRPAPAPAADSELIKGPKGLHAEVVYAKATAHEPLDGWIVTIANNRESFQFKEKFVGKQGAIRRATAAMEAWSKTGKVPFLLLNQEVSAPSELGQSIDQWARHVMVPSLSMPQKMSLQAYEHKAGAENLARFLGELTTVIDQLVASGKSRESIVTHPPHMQLIERYAGEQGASYPYKADFKKAYPGMFLPVTHSDDMMWAAVVRSYLDKIGAHH